MGAERHSVSAAVPPRAAGRHCVCEWLSFRLQILPQSPPYSILPQTFRTLLPLMPYRSATNCCLAQHHSLLWTQPQFAPRHATMREERYTLNIVEEEPLWRRLSPERSIPASP